MKTRRNFWKAVKPGTGLKESELSVLAALRRQRKVSERDRSFIGRLAARERRRNERGNLERSISASFDSDKSRVTILEVPAQERIH